MNQLLSTPASGVAAGRGYSGMPVGQEVASFATYLEAQFAVDSLSDSGFPVQLLTIVGTDLRQVERITGRMSWGRAAVIGAGSGMWIGFFFAAMMAMFGSEGTSGAMFIGCVMLGVVWGMLFQLVNYALSRGKRDFTSISQVVASRYAILASAQANEAAQGLAQVPGNLLPGGQAAQRAEERRRTRAASAGDGPSVFGSRLDEKPRFGVRVEDVQEQDGIPALAPDPDQAATSPVAGDTDVPDGAAETQTPDAASPQTTGAGPEDPQARP